MRHRGSPTTKVNFWDDLKHGHGTITFYMRGQGGKQLWSYKGEWEEDHYHGHGVETGVAFLVPCQYSVDGFLVGPDEVSKLFEEAVMSPSSIQLPFTYEGNFEQGFRHGTGFFTWENGDSYHGSFRRGERDGEGTFKLSSKALKDSRSDDKVLRYSYTGPWRRGLRCGQGTQEARCDRGSSSHYYTGHSYTGEFVEDRFHGEGVHRTIEDHGNFHDGYDSFNWSYTGQFKGHCRHGMGTWTTEGKQAGRHSYEGEWSNNQMHRQGTYTTYEFSYTKYLGARCHAWIWLPPSDRPLLGYGCHVLLSGRKDNFQHRLQSRKTKN